MKSNGRIQFCRFRATGETPDDLLKALKDNCFQPPEIGGPDEVETGFVTGQHMLDTNFTHDKNRMGGKLVFALRIDTHKVPAEIRRAYQQMNEESLAKDNPSGIVSKAQRQEAREATREQIEKERATGRHRKTKVVPILWDVQDGTVYVAGSGNAVHEEVVKIFRQAFFMELSYLSAGRLGESLALKAGKDDAFADLMPAALTPDSAGDPEGDTPEAPWVASSYATEDFLGNEFLIWLWHKVETADGTVGGYYFAVDKSLDMQCAWGIHGTQALRGDGPTRQQEAGKALATGKWPRKACLLLSNGDEHFEFTLQTDKWQVSAAQLPEVEDAETAHDLMAARCDLIAGLAKSLDTLFTQFIDDRLSPVWVETETQVRNWVINRNA